MNATIETGNGGRVIDTSKVSERDLDAAQTMRELDLYRRIKARQEILATKPLSPSRRAELHEANELDEQELALRSSAESMPLGEVLVWCVFGGLCLLGAALHMGWL